jgi:PAS domain S-box-containing protein
MWRSRYTSLVALILLAGAGLTAGLVAFEVMTARSLESRAAVQQSVRAQRLSAELETGLAASRQVANTTAALVSSMKDLKAVEGMLRQMLISTSAEYVYGIGVWFEPYQFDPDRRLVGPYVHRDLEHGRRWRTVLTYEWSTPEYDYPSQSWYQQGVDAQGTAVFTEPYFDVDFVYRTISKAFYSAEGTLLGVVSVDVILPQLRELVMRANVSPDELFYVVTQNGRLFAHPDEERLLFWGRKTGRLSPTGQLFELDLADLRAYERAHGLDRRRHTNTSPVGGPGWTVYVSSDEDVLFAEVRQVRTVTRTLAVVLWSVLLTGGATLWHSLRAREVSLVLQERLRIQEAVVRSERTLREVLETTTDAVAAVNADGRIADWNASAERMFGWKREEIIGRVAAEMLVPLEDRRLRQCQFEQLLSSGLPAISSRRLEVTALHRDGRNFPAEVILTPVASDGARQLFLFLRDLTEVVELDRMKDEFIRMTAHELNTPVTVMKSFTQQALKMDPGHLPGLRRLLEGIDRGTTRIERVVRTLLDVSELHLGRMQLAEERLDLREVVEATAKRMAEEHHDHPVKVRMQGESLVRGDRGRLAQVLVTLLDNAFRYSPPNAPVEVELRVDGSEAEVSVRDHGIGIAASKQARLFERFYRPHSGTVYDTGGLGVGLYIAREIVRRHGGSMTLESTEGEGSTVRFRLPLSSPAASSRFPLTAEGEEALP